jgi:23S rRNA (guanine1835-N2)-methyltransferase
MPAITLFNWSTGELDLVRFPVPRDYSLQAFSTADAYLLDHIAEKHAGASSAWVINDGFGAITLGLASRQPTWIGYNWSAKHAMEDNALRNSIPIPQSIWLDDSNWPSNPGIVAMSIPKELDLLEHQLYLIAKNAPKGVPVVACGMTRNIHTSTVRLFESYLGNVASSLAWKKARLITGTTDGERVESKPTQATYLDPRSGSTVLSLPGVFSADHPDPGSSLLAHSVPSIAPGSTVLDLGCGNGYLLAVAGLKNEGLKLIGCDDSRMAVHSTIQTLEINGLSGDIRHGHTTADIEEKSIDVVLCNPPFHQGHSRHDQIAWEMFTGAKKVLKPGGMFYVVGNRNLGYHIQLGRLFKSVDVHASDKTYTVFRCKKGGF